MCLHLTAGWSAFWQSYSAGKTGLLAAGHPLLITGCWPLASQNRDPANTFLFNHHSLLASGSWSLAL